MKKYILMYDESASPRIPIECDGCRYDAPLAKFDDMLFCRICADTPCGTQAEVGLGIDPILQQIAYGTNIILDALNGRKF